MRITLTDGAEFDIDDDEADLGPREVGEIFASTAEWAVEVLGPQSARDLLEAAIALQGAERN